MALGRLRRPDRRQVAWVIAVLLVVAVVGVFVVSAVPQAVGADRSYVVRSSSMSPTIQAGAVVFVEAVPGSAVEEGDVVTFSRIVDGTEQTVTHRVVDVVETDAGPQYQTQGDANEEPDEQLVPPGQVVGVVTFHVPMVGYVVNFASSGTGVAVLVVLPAVLLIANELWVLVDAVRGGDDAGAVAEPADGAEEVDEP